MSEFLALLGAWLRDQPRIQQLTAQLPQYVRVGSDVYGPSPVRCYVDPYDGELIAVRILGDRNE